MKKVYVILLNYNGWIDTVECLESVFRNDYPNYQVIVVDNDSPNNSMEYLKAWAEGKLDVFANPNNPLRNLSFPPVPKPIPYIYYTREEAEKGGSPELEEELKNKMPEDITSKYPIVFIQSGGNLGFAGGNNVGIKYSLARGDSDYVLLLNNDTVVEKKFLTELMKITNIRTNVAIIGGKILYYNYPNKIWYAGGKLDLWRGSGYHLNADKKDSELYGIKEVSFVTGCLMLVDKKVFNYIGLFSEEYFLYLEDTDFCHSALQKGFKLYVNLNSKIYHKISSTVSGNQEVSPMAIYYSTRNRLYFMMRRQKKWIRKCIFLGFFGITRLCHLIQWLLERKMGNIKAMFSGIKDGYKKD